MCVLCSLRIFGRNKHHEMLGVFFADPWAKRDSIGFLVLVKNPMADLSTTGCLELVEDHSPELNTMQCFVLLEDSRRN